MRIISHRGYWKSEPEKNSLRALSRSIKYGFGFETDIRDHNGELVISHDIPYDNPLNFNNFLKTNADEIVEKKLTLALNIKADGLAKKLNVLLQDYPLLDTFVFDMSIPDTLSYFKEGINVYERISELETSIWQDKSAGILLDGFYSEWYDMQFISDLVQEKKSICIISPELHGRNHIDLWDKLKYLQNNESLLLCTDFPEDAKNYFEGIVL
jgi:glycerophosphoryl diester phosphodiesterase